MNSRITLKRISVRPEPSYIQLKKISFLKNRFSAAAVSQKRSGAIEQTLAAINVKLAVRNVSTCHENREPRGERK